MELQEIIGNARDAITVRRVFGDPIEKDGVVIIPAAVLRGGAGIRASEGPAGEQRTGTRGGYGLNARPVGAFVLKDGLVTWRPAVDVLALLRVAAFGLGFFGAAMIRLLGRRWPNRVAMIHRRTPHRLVRARFMR